MAEAARNWSKDVKSLGDSIVALSLLQAKELGDYLKEEHGLEAAAGAAVMMAGPAAGGAAAPAAVESTEFNVILTDGGDKKIQVIKEVRAATGLGLKEAKDLVEGAPKTVKEGMDKAGAEDLKKKIEAAGGKVKVEGV